MHIPTPGELKARREILDMRQAELARKAGISQSMVARIESGSVDPRLSTLKRIVAVLDSEERPRVIARDVMHTPVLFVDPECLVSEAIGIMNQNGISQLPVIDDGTPVGCISETAIVDAIEGQRTHRSPRQTVAGVMESGFPTVPPDIDIGTVVRILQSHHAVLVLDMGKVIGVITKHDLIPLISGR
ncbi:MAG: CBS domain-containing protein [Methanoregulaceae archaeon]|nr:CBS domain-containing protein [Methanoregulaceae archaeon]